MDNLAKKRLIIDFERIKQDFNSGVCAAPKTSNFLLWKGVIFGPPDTPYEDGTFKIRLRFTKEYPMKPPKVRFVSKMFHPNIKDNGDIFVDILDNKWSPMYDVASLLLAIQSMLNEPNLSFTVNGEAAKLFVHNRKEYERRVSETVQWSWYHEKDIGDVENEIEDQYESDEGELQGIISYSLKYNSVRYIRRND
ncbi:Ubiquitin-conjugating enzyme E2-17 kDa [Gryllus bimaculatus]|nr:Ubiquitin-conjugating enzyme E2-17 kDa [Gryllus bimaculatus]